VDEKDPHRKKDQLKAHSLPGTNQAGKGPGSCEKDHDDMNDQLKAHSLPGTNQAGKGPGSCQNDDQDNKPGGGTSQRPDGQKQP
jgi:hypothetical protein